MSDETQQNSEQEVMALSLQNQGQKTTTLKLSTKYGELPGKRPIEASNLIILRTFGFNRPILASDMQISSMITLSGNRPISISHLKISEKFTVMGNRPVASNELDDSGILMGYLD